MFRRIAIVLLIFAWAGPVLAIDYIAERKAAMELMNNRQYEQAYEQFKQMSEADVTPTQKADAIEHAVECLIRLERFEDAEKLIERNPFEGSAAVCRMRIMMNQHQYDKLIETYGESDISKWPDYLKDEAYSMRASAAHRQEKAKLAASDYRKAYKWEQVDRHKADLMTGLGDVYAHMLDKPDEAMEAYRQGQDVGGLYRGTRATIHMADLLIEQGRAREALEEMEQWFKRVDISQMQGNYWPDLTIQAHARVLAAAGEIEKAIARYKQALSLDDLRESSRKRIEEILAELQDNEQSE